MVREQVTRPRKTFLHTPSSSKETDFTLQIDCLIYVLFRSNCLIRQFLVWKEKNLLDVFERSLLSSHCFHKIQIQLICNLLTEFSTLAKVIFEGATYLLLLDSSWREKIPISMLILITYLNLQLGQKDLQKSSFGTFNSSLDGLVKLLCPNGL